MKKLTFTKAMMNAAIFGTPANQKTKNGNMEKTGETFVLVHGAWQAPYAWGKVRADLWKAGANGDRYSITRPWQWQYINSSVNAVYLQR